MVCDCEMIQVEGRKKRDARSNGNSKNLIYFIWVGIRHRCRKYGNYAQSYIYSDRGIGMSLAWAESFEQFALDMGPRPSASHSVDRIDNALGYCKHNCRWATPYEQVLNRRMTKNVMPLGVYRRKNGRFSVRRTVNGREKHLGTFDTVEQAIEAQAEFEKQLGI
jgi:hypothetical protein